MVYERLIPHFIRLNSKCRFISMEHDSNLLRGMIYASKPIGTEFHECNSAFRNIDFEMQNKISWSSIPCPKEALSMSLWNLKSNFMIKCRSIPHFEILTSKCGIKFHGSLFRVLCHKII